MGLSSKIKKVKDLFFIGVEKIRKSFVKVKNKLTRFFQKAIDMMKKVVEKLADKVRRVILGATHFFRKVGNKFQEGTKNYSLEEELGEWNETTVTREIKFEDVPPKYKTLDDEFEVDDTRELDEALAC